MLQSYIGQAGIGNTSVSLAQAKANLANGVIRGVDTTAQFRMTSSKQLTPLTSRELFPTTHALKQVHGGSGVDFSQQQTVYVNEPWQNSRDVLLTTNGKSYSNLYHMPFNSSAEPKLIPRTQMSLAEIQEDNRNAGLNGLVNVYAVRGKPVNTGEANEEIQKTDQIQ